MSSNGSTTICPFCGVFLSSLEAQYQAVLDKCDLEYRDNLQKVFYYWFGGHYFDCLRFVDQIEERKNDRAFLEKIIEENLPVFEKAQTYFKDWKVRCLGDPGKSKVICMHNLRKTLTNVSILAQRSTATPSLRLHYHKLVIELREYLTSKNLSSFRPRCSWYMLESGKPCKEELEEKFKIPYCLKHTSLLLEPFFVLSDGDNHPPQDGSLKSKPEAGSSKKKQSKTETLPTEATEKTPLLHDSDSPA